MGTSHRKGVASGSSAQQRMDEVAERRDWLTTWAAVLAGGLLLGLCAVGFVLAVVRLVTS